MMELAGKKIAVIGLGRSGAAAARFLDERGARLVLADRNPAIDRGSLPRGEVRLGEEDREWLGGVELVVASPGVSPANALLAEAARLGIPIIGELELASRFLTAPMVAITGTNGKSTVTVMTAGIFKTAGRRVFAGGNLGTPLIEATRADYELAVIEVSSFQLERIEHLRPRVGVYLNLSDDHFERYRGLEDYGRAKAALFRNQGPGDWAILNRDDPRVWALDGQIRARVLSFGLSSAARVPALHLEGRDIVFALDSRRGRISLEGLKPGGRHSLMNAMAAAGAALAMGVEAAVIERGLASFRGLPHRIEFVHALNGVSFVDDSKATNVGAVIEALAAVPAPVILIAGGMDKGGDYAPLRAPLRERVKLLILIGAAREKMRAALAGTIDIVTVATLDEAVAIAAGRAVRDDTVMLSPACSSFDQFRDYAERGDLFQKLVRAL